MPVTAHCDVRDPRIEEPSNRWLIHPLGRSVLPLALRAGLSANSVSLLGLLFGAGAALAYGMGRSSAALLAGLALSTCWLILDGLDGMVARARGTQSAAGRLLDGLCDHGVFVMIYVALALRLGTGEGWMLAIAAGAVHAVQSALYEGERARFHRRAAGRLDPQSPASAESRILRLYDRLSTAPDRGSRRFESRLAAAKDRGAIIALYTGAATGPMRLMWVQTANVRVFAIFVAASLGDPRLFWWFEIVLLSLAAAAAMIWHRGIERALTK
ncbi:CDP-alcohol phosphatidyltransferase family protein [Croceicoccus hydrothermalis]|uniref:CDP-alcohol phosphatidyltransferase family protein n=1 Tax=Croceicoccus hydrothermalis TaxID=2867964 RepID=UPI001EFA2E98|nr:CDP-alcohol phosphatidyltransferase family protein [Croceicoccus hydrothermalis]